MKAEFAALRSEIAAFEVETRNEFAAIRVEMETEFATVGSEMKLLGQQLTIKPGAMLVARGGIPIAAIRTMPVR